MIDGKPTIVHVNVNVTIEYKMVTDFTTIKDNENILFIVDDVLPIPGDKEGGGNPVGRVTVGGNTAAVEYKYRKDFTTLLHEFGHNLGFWFKDNPSDEHHSKDPKHLMNATGAGSGNNNLNAEDKKRIFRFAAFANSGSYHYGGGNSKKKCKKFLKRKQL